MDGKQRIKQAALGLFVKEGLSVSTAAIAKAAGVSSSLLYHHYPNKEAFVIDLYEDCFVEEYRRTSVLFRDYEKEGAKGYYETSRQSFYAVLDWAFSNWSKYQFMRLFESSLLAGQVTIENNERIAEAFSDFSKFAAYGIERGYIKDKAPELNVAISRLFQQASAEYLRNHPEYLDDAEFMNGLAFQHWQAAGCTFASYEELCAADF